MDCADGCCVLAADGPDLGTSIAGRLGAATCLCWAAAIGAGGGTVAFSGVLTVGEINELSILGI